LPSSSPCAAAFTSAVSRLLPPPRSARRIGTGPRRLWHEWVWPQPAPPGCGSTNMVSRHPNSSTSLGSRARALSRAVLEGMPPSLLARELARRHVPISLRLGASIYPGPTSTGTRFHIPDFSLISGSSGDKASTRSRGPAARVTCHGNQDSLRLVLARAVACRA